MARRDGRRGASDLIGLLIALAIIGFAVFLIINAHLFPWMAPDSGY